MQRATAHEARGYWHAGRGNGRAANAHFARARQLRSAFGARLNDEYDRVAGEIVRAYNARLHAKLESLPRAIELFAAELRRVFHSGAPGCITQSVQRSDEVLLHGGGARLVVQLGAFNRRLFYQFHDAGEMHRAEGNKRELDEYELGESELGARKRAEYENDAAMES